MTDTTQSQRPIDMLRALMMQMNDGPPDEAATWYGWRVQLSNAILAMQADSQGNVDEDWFRVGASGVSLNRVISISPEVARGVVNVQLRDGGYQNIPATDPIALAHQMNDAKSALSGVRVVS